MIVGRQRGTSIARQHRPGCTLLLQSKDRQVPRTFRPDAAPSLDAPHRRVLTIILKRTLERVRLFPWHASSQGIAS